MSAEAPLGALDGVRIVDLTQMLAGPYCTMLLADQGAEIIKVEPLDGDHTRIIGPYHADDQLKAFGGYFASVNRNKHSIAIDLKQPQGRDLVMKLCENADDHQAICYTDPVITQLEQGGELRVVAGDLEGDSMRRTKSHPET